MKWWIRKPLHWLWPNYWFKHIELKTKRAFRLKMNRDRDEALKRLNADWEAIGRDFAKASRDMEIACRDVGDAIREVGRAIKP